MGGKTLKTCTHTTAKYYTCLRRVHKCQHLPHWHDGKRQSPDWQSLGKGEKDNVQVDVCKNSSHTVCPSIVGLFGVARPLEFLVVWDSFLTVKKSTCAQNRFCRESKVQNQIVTEEQRPHQCCRFRQKGKRQTWCVHLTQTDLWLTCSCHETREIRVRGVHLKRNAGAKVLCRQKSCINLTVSSFAQSHAFHQQCWVTW